MMKRCEVYIFVLISVVIHILLMLLVRFPVYSIVKPSENSYVMVNIVSSLNNRLDSISKVDIFAKYSCDQAIKGSEAYLKARLIKQSTKKRHIKKYVKRKLTKNKRYVSPKKKVIVKANTKKSVKKMLNAKDSIDNKRSIIQSPESSSIVRKSGGIKHCKYTKKTLPSTVSISSLRFRKKVKPRYPFIARQLGYQGKVKVAFIVDKEGVVKSVNILCGSGIPVLDRAAVNAVKKWLFYPVGKKVHIVTYILFVLKR